jgi:hypothetical protein
MLVPTASSAGSSSCRRTAKARRLLHDLRSKFLAGRSFVDEGRRRRPRDGGGRRRRGRRSACSPSTRCHPELIRREGDGVSLVRGDLPMREANRELNLESSSRTSSVARVQRLGISAASWTTCEREWPGGILPRGYHIQSEPVWERRGSRAHALRPRVRGGARHPPHPVRSAPLAARRRS